MFAAFGSWITFRHEDPTNIFLERCRIISKQIAYFWHLSTADLIQGVKLMIFCPTSNAVISDQDLNIDVNIPRQMSWSNYCGYLLSFLLLLKSISTKNTHAHYLVELYQTPISLPFHWDNKSVEKNTLFSWPRTGRNYGCNEAKKHSCNQL